MLVFLILTHVTRPASALQQSVVTFFDLAIIALSRERAKLLHHSSILDILRPLPNQIIAYSFVIVYFYLRCGVLISLHEFGYGFRTLGRIAAEAEVAFVWLLCTLHLNDRDSQSVRAGVAIVSLELQFARINSSGE